MSKPLQSPRLAILCGGCKHKIGSHDRRHCTKPGCDCQRSRTRKGEPSWALRGSQAQHRARREAKR